jgi:hypothetical protein
MDPLTIALIFQALDLAIKAAPEVVELVHEIKVAIGKEHAQTLQQVADGTIQVSQETLAILAPLLAKAVVTDAH